MKRPGFTHALTQQRTSVGFSLDKRQDLRLIKLNEYLLFAITAVQISSDDTLLDWLSP